MTDRTSDTGPAALRTWDPIYRELQRLCPDCRSPKQAGTEHGYGCPAHRDLFMAALAARPGPSATKWPAEWQGHDHALTTLGGEPVMLPVPDCAACNEARPGPSGDADAAWEALRLSLARSECSDGFERRIARHRPLIEAALREPLEREVESQKHARRTATIAAESAEADLFALRAAAPSSALDRDRLTEAMRLARQAVSWTPEAGDIAAEYDRLTGATAPSDGAGGLDVERLARAIRYVTEKPVSLGSEADSEMDESDWLANAYAAEYARLQESGEGVQ